MVKINGRFNFADYLIATKLHAKRGWLMTCLLYYFIGALSIMTVGGVVAAIQGRMDWGLLLFPASFLAFLVAYQFIILPRQVARMFNQQKSLSAPFEMEMTDEGLLYRNEFGSGLTLWSHFIKWKENKEMLLLYRNDIMFNMLPRRLFHDESEIDFVHAKLRQGNIPSASKVRDPIQVGFVVLVIVVAIGALICNFFSR